MTLSIDEVLFSRSTYQVEVMEGGTAYWTFLQFNELDQRVDAFCSCGRALCKHVEAADKWLRDKGQLLHRRFEKSFWYQLGRIGFELFGDVPAGIVEGFEFLLENRVVETEGSSLKFAQLSQEERQAWRDGHPPDWLRFELSAWSDLAKWWFLAKKSSVRMGEWWVDATSGDKRWRMEVPEALVPQLVPALAHFALPGRCLGSCNLQGCVMWRAGWKAF